MNVGFACVGDLSYGDPEIAPPPVGKGNVVTIAPALELVDINARSNCHLFTGSDHHRIWVSKGKVSKSRLLHDGLYRGKKRSLSAVRSHDLVKCGYKGLIFGLGKPQLCLLLIVETIEFRTCNHFFNFH